MDFYHDSLDANCLAVATRTGSLFIFSLHRWIWKDREAWISEVDKTTVNPSEGNCMAISAHRIAAVGTTKGALVLHKMEHQSDNAILDGRVFNTVQNLSWLQPDLLAAFHIKGIIVLWRVETRSSLSAMRLMILNTTTNEIPTCLVMFENRRQCVAGDSRGTLPYSTLILLIHCPTTRLMRLMYAIGCTRKNMSIMLNAWAITVSCQ
jgi:hypothetical protein